MADKNEERSETHMISDGRRTMNRAFRLGDCSDPAYKRSAVETVECPQLPLQGLPFLSVSLFC
jgi:hypothetical protein